jgi:hypothetical protein
MAFFALRGSLLALVGTDDPTANCLPFPKAQSPTLSYSTLIYCFCFYPSTLDWAKLSSRCISYRSSSAAQHAAASSACDASCGSPTHSNDQKQPQWVQGTGLDASDRPSQRENLLLVRKPHAESWPVLLGLVQQSV